MRYGPVHFELPSTFYMHIPNVTTVSAAYYTNVICVKEKAITRLINQIDYDGPSARPRSRALRDCPYCVNRFGCYRLFHSNHCFPPSLWLLPWRSLWSCSVQCYISGNEQWSEEYEKGSPYARGHFHFTLYSRRFVFEMAGRSQLRSRRERHLMAPRSAVVWNTYRRWLPSGLSF